MKLNSDHLRQLESYAITAAQKAGAYIARTRPCDIQHKEGGDCPAAQVLTEVDHQSQSLILEILNPTFSEYDLALLTEENEDDGSRLKKDYFWCIDPIDGTLPFIEGVPGYAVSIALVSRKGVPQIGVVFDPVEQNLYHAVRAQGVFRNHLPWKPNAGRQEASLQVFTDRSVLQKAWFLKANEVLEANVSGHGGAVMNAIWALEHPPACYFKFPKPGEGGGCLWDFAATACIYNESGAIASDMYGAPLDLNRPDSLFMNHRGILFATDSVLADKIRSL
ncbi:MAG TPA: inositol monophosphatase family protein [Pontiella sp.]